MFKVKNKDTRTTPVKSFWCLYIFKHISHHVLMLVFLLLTLSRKISAGFAKICWPCSSRDTICDVIFIQKFFWQSNFWQLGNQLLSKTLDKYFYQGCIIGEHWSLMKFCENEPHVGIKKQHDFIQLKSVLLSALIKHKLLSFNSLIVFAFKTLA